MSSTPPGARIAVYIPSFSDGGVEKMMVTLAGGFAQAGFATDFLTRPGELPYLERLDPAVRLIRLPAERPAQRRATIDYLRRERPAVLMSAKGKDDALALIARDAADCGTQVFLRCGIHLSSRPKMSPRNPLRRWWHARRIRAQFRAADGVICVSDGVADDVAELAGLPRAQVLVIRNPTLVPDLAARAAAPLDHPWFAAGQPPVILGAGSLAPVKHFELLVEAAAGVMRERAARLVILGEGKERARLTALAAQLGIADRFALPGFVDNVHAWMSRAAVFVLSSEREGSPNVLTEALACGTPSVATDCPSGPREILAGGRYGPLIPMFDAAAMRAAILSVLAAPQAAATLRAAVADYTLERSRDAYLRAFGLLAETPR
ncbi:glycosyltransferase [Plasticicumulans acidivorans]|uniref:Glycosyltransferase involved in cell wall biosynthesis n=1 Tax=Plasticicumulans acidivorans TaxID=886464 RepID=A0A317MVY3_9GAMM|nr:glycosyltransferase [Plasticicumulans acidivorans]PWV62522.1 glycosyltransferase involved in cell wall biosynthesis [Plasticicumulans acidivorans]